MCDMSYFVCLVCCKYQVVIQQDIIPKMLLKLVYMSYLSC